MFCMILYVFVISYVIKIKNKWRKKKIKELKFYKLYILVYICILLGNKNYYSIFKVIWVFFFECLVLNFIDS